MIKYSAYRPRGTAPLSSVMDASAGKGFVTTDVLGVQGFMSAGLANEAQFECDAPNDWTRRRG